MSTPEEREKAWWQSWREEDYSWDGLADKRPFGGGPTLQEYWADEKDHLIPDPSDPEGRRYTRFHLPLTWADGTPTEKASWSEDEHRILAEELERRLQDALDTDHETRFDGVVLLTVPKMPPPKPEREESKHPKYVEVDFHRAWLKPGTTWAGQVFGHAAFSNATFSGEAGFRGVSFSGDTWFFDATFSRDAWFGGATFLGSAEFRDATFSGNAGFGGVTFSGNVGFRDATFSEDAGFVDATFSGNAWFGGATFSEDAWFGGATFSGNAGFAGATFSGNVRFRDATFSENAGFVDATFSGNAEEDQRLTFQDAVAKSGFLFFPAAFPSDPRFASGAFHGMVFEEIAYFGGAFHQFASFEGADPRKDIRFSKTENTPSSVGRIGVLSSLVNATQNVEQDKDEELKKLIGGAQILQIVSDRYRRREDERWFHRLELLAKEHLSTTSPFERFLTNAYAWTSDFGGSIGRPLLSMGIVTLACASLFWINAFNLGTNCPRLVHQTCEWENSASQAMPALTFAANSAFRPAYAVSREERIANDFEKRILFGKGWKGALRAGFLGTLSTLQSLFSIVMLFLTGLAARRRFQLS